MGPSIRCLLLLSLELFGVLLVEGVPEPGEASAVLLLRGVDALCILQRSTVASLDPVTR